MVESELTWLHPDELKFEAEKHFSSVNTVFLLTSDQLASLLGAPFKQHFFLKGVNLS